jgi:hypothetical protein
MNADQSAAGQKFMAILQHHFVPLLLEFHKEDQAKAYYISAFVMSVRDHWFLVTAGHCFKEVKEIREGGWTLYSTRLVDNMGDGARHMDPIPFDYDAARPTPIHDAKWDIDYGLIFVSPLYRKAMETNGVEALSEKYWDVGELPYVSFRLLGIPAELTQNRDDSVYASVTLHPVERLAERPGGFEATDAPTFWGRISLPQEVGDIRGTSGGPIFGFAKICAETRYFLVAVQSGWVKPHRTVRACLARPFGQLISEVLREREVVCGTSLKS